MFARGRTGDAAGLAGAATPGSCSAPPSCSTRVRVPSGATIS
ncbi:MAG: hypothetical protein U0168_24810 [Nannocystaceae bacterium]